MFVNIESYTWNATATAHTVNATATAHSAVSSNSTVLGTFVPITNTVRSTDCIKYYGEKIELRDNRVDDLKKRIEELEKDRKDRDRVIELLYESICDSEKNGAKHSYPEELRHLLFDMT